MIATYHLEHILRDSILLHIYQELGYAFLTRLDIPESRSLLSCWNFLTTHSTPRLVNKPYYPTYKNISAHRLIYHLCNSTPLSTSSRKKISSRLKHRLPVVNYDIHHYCYNTFCANPYHLTALTRSENIADRYKFYSFTRNEQFAYFLFQTKHLAPTRIFISRQLRLNDEQLTKLCGAEQHLPFLRNFIRRAQSTSALDVAISGFRSHVSRLQVEK